MSKLRGRITMSLSLHPSADREGPTQPSNGGGAGGEKRGSKNLREEVEWERSGAGFFPLG